MSRNELVTIAVILFSATSALAQELPIQPIEGQRMPRVLASDDIVDDIVEEDGPQQPRFTRGSGPSVWSFDKPLGRRGLWLFTEGMGRNDEWDRNVSYGSPFIPSMVLGISLKFDLRAERPASPQPRNRGRAISLPDAFSE